MPVRFPNDVLKTHLSPGGPKRILALDGGGVRGIVTLAILERIETLLAELTPDPDAFVLADYFDLVAGTSTGSIIATMLARGDKVSRILAFYRDFAPQIFRRPQGLGVLSAKFNARALEEALSDELGDGRLGGPELKTGLLVCAKRIDTGSAWAMSNHPGSKFYHASPGQSYRPNKDYELKTLVRASTAAPFFFAPLRITLADGSAYTKEIGVFVDGGAGGDNDPALQSLKVALLPAYGFGWEKGADKLLVISVGAGWRRPRIALHKMPWLNVTMAQLALAGLIQDTVKHNIATLQSLSNPRKPFYINLDLDDMRGEMIVEKPAFSYQRYDASMERADVEAMVGNERRKVRKLDRMFEGLVKLDNAAPDNLEPLYRLGQRSTIVTRKGMNGIEIEDFPPVFDPPGFRRTAADPPPQPTAPLAEITPA